MKKSRLAALATAGVATLGLSGAALVGPLMPVASAATTSVTIPEPAMSSLDPAQWGAQILIDQGTIFEGLFGYNTKNQIVPKIAQSWKVSDGGRVWTIYLRHNARWSNGAPVTAQDFQFAWMRLLAPTDTAGAIWAGVTNHILNGYQYHAGSVPASKVGIKVLNNYALQITLTAPHNIEADLALAASMPLYPPDVQKHPTTWFEPQYFVGDGPYVVSKFTTNGNVVLTRNKRYVGRPGTYNVGNIQTITVIPAPTVGVEDYEANKLSVTLIGSTSDYKYALGHLKSQLHRETQANLNTLAYDKSVDPSPLDNQKVREAIAYAIDRAPIVNPVLAGMGLATNVFGYPGFPTYSVQHNPYGTYHLAKARALLAAAGHKNGKGMPVLRLYVQPAANNPQEIPAAEAVAQELKAIGIRTKIDTVNSTLYGEYNWGGIEPDVKPGYLIGDGTANWNSTPSWPLQANQWIQLTEDSGSIGPASYRQHAERWNFSSYDPNDVKAWGNPNDTKLGITYASWEPIIKAADKDIAYLNAWTKRQPKAFQAALTTPGTPSLKQQLNNFLASWRAAKTDTAKHAAWVAFWKWVGSFPNGGTGGASLGLNAQVYVDQHEPRLQYLTNMWTLELVATPSNATAKKLVANIDNAVLQSAYIEPLWASELIYLAKPGLTHVMPNPWAWGNFYQLQYMEMK